MVSFAILLMSPFCEVRRNGIRAKFKLRKEKRSDLIRKLQIYLDQAGIENLVPPGNVETVELNLHMKQGLSNKTYLLDIKTKTLSKTFILKAYNTNDNKALREFRLLKVLKSKNLPVPEAYLLEESGKILGKPFIIMEKINNTQPKDEQQLIDAVAYSLVKVHEVKPSELKNILEDKGNYPQRELDELKTLAVLSTFLTIGASASFMKYIKYISFLKPRAPKGRAFLVHGDYGFDNIIYSNGKAYVIDWESADIAEPTFDVAYICNFLDFYEQVKSETKEKLSEKFIESYEKYGGTLIELNFYRKLAALRLLLLLDILSSRGLLTTMIKIQLGLREQKLKSLKEFFIDKFKSYLLTVLEEKY